MGGIVDRNRYKGICYKRAAENGIKTAKLPIGDYMQMNSRFVLTTNQVCEIMLRWLELRDWSEAFMQVMPKRKGGMLKELPFETTSGCSAQFNPHPHTDDAEHSQTTPEGAESSGEDAEDGGVKINQIESDANDGAGAKAPENAEVENEQ